MMTLADMLAELRTTLSGVENGGLCAEWILEEATGVPRLEMVHRSGEPVDGGASEKVRGWGARVAAGEPIQYVLGWTSFRGHRIRTDRRALIPRPETEQLVTRVRQVLSAPAKIVDVGAGTGCIAIALCLEEPGVRVCAIDREEAALALAAENVAAHGLEDRIELKQGDLLDDIPRGSIDMVVSNPPYVAEAEMPGLPANVRDYEPSSALVSGPEGLDAIRRLIPQARRCLKPGGRLLMEIGETQAGEVAGLMIQAGFVEVDVHRDLAERERMVSGRANVPDVPGSRRSFSPSRSR